MKEEKSTYVQLKISIKRHEEDLIRTSTALEQGEVGIEWKTTWSEIWNS